MFVLLIPGIFILSSLLASFFTSKHYRTNVLFLYDSDHGSQRQPGDVSGKTTYGEHILSDNKDIFSKMGKSRSRKYHLGLSSSDAEVDYRRGRSLREGRGDFAWHD